jgi:hypothetical protein
MKHKIFVGRILPEEKKQASLLFSAFQEELASHGALETEIVADIVLNRLQKHRIDKYVAYEFEKSSRNHFIGFLERHEHEMALYWRRHAIPGGWSDRVRLPPGVCVTILADLRNDIENRGLLPADHLKVLNFVYGDQFTELGARMVSEYNEVMRMDVGQRTEDDKVRKSKRAEYQQSTLDAIDVEIARQKAQLELKTQLEEMEVAADVPAPPPAAALDLILRYSAANMREFKQLLDALKCIRKLKGDT